MLCSNCERGVKKCNRNCPAAFGKPTLEQAPGRRYDLWGTPAAAVPEGFYPVGRAHAGTVCEGLSHGRGHMLEQEEIVRRREQPRAAVMH